MPRSAVTIEVIVDEEDEVGTLARSHADAPEIDGVVYLEGVFDLAPGTRLKVRVDEADEHDLWATPAVSMPQRGAACWRVLDSSARAFPG
jgi:tRNA A37 methylthiotransferase MiaB